MKETLNLPKTDFPMKANLAQREPEALKAWEDTRLYQQIIEKNKKKPPFILHDGPPYANSPIHIGTALNKILKDIVVRYKNMSGFKSEYVPGWDCHGLPIELQATKKLGSKKGTLAPLELRDLCRKHAEKYVDIQRQQFKRLGVLGEWEAPYLTMSFSYEAQIIRELATLSRKDYLYRAKRSIHWCPSCETALAEAEIEYAQKTSPSIYVKFELTAASLKKLAPTFPVFKNKKVFVLIWTTTPWTIPANMAIALHPEFEYVAVEEKGEMLILAKSLLSSVKEVCKLTSAKKEVATLKADDLLNLKTQHPFLQKESIILTGDHVTAETGTGCVHTAPGHGADDYFLGVKHGLDIFSPVNHRGCFTSEMPDYEGEFVFKTNEKIVERLRASGHLLERTDIEHSYPHCWRCKKPVIFRATEQWFVSMNKGDLRKKSLDWIKKTEWIPSWGQKRIEGMMENRPDWCISRQRFWGVPIPALHCTSCNHVHMEASFMEKVADAVEKKGGDAWYEMVIDFACPQCNKKTLRKETDILDVWFDSGCSFSAVLEQRSNLSIPADLYLEGSDQHRGWFHTSLLVSTATRDIAPYKAVLTHGFVVDGKGRKMSKSVGNVVDPEKVIKQHGAEILRLWVASENYQNDVSCSDELIKRSADVYRKIRNTCKHILGNLYDFDPERDSVEKSDLLEIDRYALLRLHQFIDRATKHYNAYEFHSVFYHLNNYCVVELSSFYLDILKDRLYTYGKNSPERRAAQTVLYEILDSLIRLMAPILVFTSEELYRFLPNHKEKSAHLLEWPTANKDYLDATLEKNWGKLAELRGHVLKALEEARNSKAIGNALEAKVILSLPAAWEDLCKQTEMKLADLFIVSQVEIKRGASGLSVTIEKAEGLKCVRCWIWSTTVKDTESTCEKCQTALR